MFELIDAQLGPHLIWICMTYVFRQSPRKGIVLVDRPLKRMTRLAEHEQSVFPATFLTRDRLYYQTFRSRTSFSCRQVNEYDAGGLVSLCDGAPRSRLICT